MKGGVRPADLDGLEGDCPGWFDAAMRVPRRETEVEVDGSPVRAYRWGDPAMPGVVLAHGFLAHARSLCFIAPLLSDRFCVVAYDLSGMGDSPKHPHFRPEHRGMELIEVARDAGLFGGDRRPFIVAHSLGGHSGMTAIEQQPEAFGGLVICDMMLMRPSVAERYFDAGRPISWPAKETPHKVRPDLASILERYRLMPEQPIANPFLLEYIARHSVRAVDGGYVWKFDPAVRVTDGHPAEWWIAQPQRFVDLPIRKAFVFGERSRVFPADSLAYLREISDGAFPLVGIPDAHHHLMVDQPLALASALRAILEVWQSSDRDGG